MRFPLRLALHQVRPLNLDVVNASLHAVARKALERGDVCGFLCVASGGNALPLLIDNIGRLKAMGLYEEGLAYAWPSAKHTNVHIDLVLQKALFELADRAKLATSGAPCRCQTGW